MEVDDFEAKTEVFLSWLSQMGVKINPKMALVDMRSSGRGRGASKSSHHLLPTHWNLLQLCYHAPMCSAQLSTLSAITRKPNFFCHLLTLHQLPLQTSEKMKSFSVYHDPLCSILQPLLLPLMLHCGLPLAACLRGWYVEPPITSARFTG